LEYRIKNNGFKTKNEIMKVKGIGKVKFEKMKDKICIE
jgi:DNA uptake protein ComE-like DNA-binding protein